MSEKRRVRHSRRIRPIVLLLAAIVTTGVALLANLWAKGALQETSPFGQWAKAPLFHTTLAMRRSTLGRWWSRRGARLPDVQSKLQSGTVERVKIRYSWLGGYGYGDVLLDLDGTGDCSVRVRRPRGRRYEGFPWAPGSLEVYQATIPSQRITEILVAVRDSQFLTLNSMSVPWLVFDLGQYTVSVEIDGIEKQVFVDTQWGVEDPQAFFAVVAKILSLRREVGFDFELGPLGTTSVGQNVDPQAPAA